jgi:hypothetical protein
VTQGRATYREFFDVVADELPALLPPDLRDYRSARQGSVFKVWFGPRSTQHFEAWFRDGGVELAFHLEGRTQDDLPVERVLRTRLRDLRRRLGGELSIEPFGRDWVRLYEHWPSAERSVVVALEVVGRFAEWIREVEPLLRRAGFNR